MFKSKAMWAFVALVLFFALVAPVEDEKKPEDIQKSDYIMSITYE